MLSRRHLAAGLAAALPLALAPARSRAAESPLARSPEAPADFSAPIKGGLDPQERLTIPVMIGGVGPFNFAVDTGADRSCISDQLAVRLTLPADAPVRVHGISGSALMPTVRIAGLTIGQDTFQGGVVPVLSRDHLGVDGLLGVEVLQNRRLVINYRERLLELRQPNRDAEYAPAARSALVPARNRQGLLTVAGARADGVPVEAFIDSGGAFSVGNMALAAALGRQFASQDAFPPTMRMVDITGAAAIGQVHVVRTLKFGSMWFSDMGLVFCDLHVFDRWDLADKPALLLGANALRQFSRIEMDYGRKRIFFQMAADPQIWLA